MTVNSTELYEKFRWTLAQGRSSRKHVQRKQYLGLDSYWRRDRGLGLVREGGENGRRVLGHLGPRERTRKDLGRNPCEESVVTAFDPSV